MIGPTLAGVNTNGRARPNRNIPGSSRSALCVATVSAIAERPLAAPSSPMVTSRRGSERSAMRPVSRESSGVHIPAVISIAPAAVALRPRLFWRNSKRYTVTPRTEP